MKIYPQIAIQADGTIRTVQWEPGAMHTIPAKKTFGPFETLPQYFLQTRAHKVDPDGIEHEVIVWVERAESDIMKPEH